jgi:hypothetical protein
MGFRRTSKNQRDNDLQGAIRQLEALAASTEGEFLRLGEGLHRFRGRSRRIAEGSAAITAKMNGPEMNQAMAGLRTILTGVRALDASSREDTDHFRSILGGIDGMRNSLEGFTKLVRHLPALCSFIKIESARMESNRESFSTLSEDVRNLARRIEEKSSQFLDRSLSLSTLLRKDLAEIEGFSAGRQGQALSILDDASRCLNAITAQHTLSATALREVTDRWERIARGIGEVVASLQFHDITRQRIEHAHTALSEIGPGQTGLPGGLFTRLRKLSGKTAPGDGESLPAAVHACDIQRAQLDHARGEVVGAVRHILATLGQIAGHVHEIGDQCGHLLNASDRKEDSFLGGLEKGVSSLSLSMREYDRIHAQISAMIDQATEAIGTMSGFIGEIKNLGIEIRMIALNAAVRAAHAGENGLALGVLAESIQQLSSATARQTERIAADLTLVVTAASELARRVHRGQDEAGKEPREMAQEMARTLESLRQIDAGTLATLARITAEGASLAGDIATLSAKIGVHERFDREIREVNGALERLAAALRADLPGGGKGTPPLVENGAEDRYTMNSERVIHRAVLGTAALPVLAPGGGGIPPAAEWLDTGAGPAARTVMSPPEEANNAGDDLGDNVELF